MGSLQKGRQEADGFHYYDRVQLPDRCRARAGESEQREMNTLLEFLKEGGVGNLPEQKRDGWVRIMFENWNSLGVFTHNWKLDR